MREAASADCLSALLEAAPDPDSVMPRYSLTALLVDRLHLLGWTFEGGVSVSDALGTFAHQFPRASFEDDVGVDKGCRVSSSTSKFFCRLGGMRSFCNQTFLADANCRRPRPIP